MPLPRAVTLRLVPLLCLPLLLATTPAGAQADATPAATALPAPSA